MTVNPDGLPGPGANYCVCVVGWHLGTDVFRRLKDFGIRNVFLASHRPLEQITPEVIEIVGSTRVHAFPNRGYDWGAFRQFTDAGLHRPYDYCVFMHDDVEIVDANIFLAAIAKLKTGAVIVGNGRNSDRCNWFAIGEGHSYAHARELPPGLDFAHETVRGSFFAIRSKTIDELGGFDVFWDPYRLMIETGNLSLIATCGRIAARYGGDVFAFLGDSECRSAYMVEAIRGGAAPDKRWRLSRKLKAQLFKVYKWIAVLLLRREIGGADPASLTTRLMQRFVAAISGNDACLRRFAHRVVNENR